MSKAEYWQRGESIDYKNTGSSAIEANSVIVLGKRVGVAGMTIQPGETGSLHVKGVFRFEKDDSEIIRSIVKKGEVLNAVTPDIFGKERRKLQPSKQGKLGVEGIPDELIIEALKNCGAVIDGEAPEKHEDPLTRTDLMELGLIGGENSAERRRELQKRLGLPELLSAKLLLEMGNRMFSRSGFIEAVRKMDEEQK